MPPLLLKIPERGTVEVPRVTSERLASEPAFWQLVQAGIVTVEQGSASTVRLKGGCYVGRANIGEHTIIQLEEKIPGSLVALLRHASGAEFRLHRIPSTASELGPLISILIDQFNYAVSAYLSRGRRFAYRLEQRTGAIIGGKLNIVGTIKLRSRGLRHLAQFAKNRIAFDTPFNIVMLAALREVDRIHNLIEIDAAVMARSRALALLFSDCRNAEVVFGARELFIRRAAAQERELRDPQLQDIMALAGVLLSRESFEPSHNKSRPAPRAWFLNLEALFEVAVRNVLGDVLRGLGSVRNGRSNQMPIFGSGARHLANPDLVIRFNGGSSVIGDAKFKTQETRSDLYQILVHAASYDAQSAFLVSPGDTFSVEDFGVAKTGSTVRNFTVDVTKLETHLRQLAAAITP